MTRDEILAMKPGKELDVMIAETIMGQDFIRADLLDWPDRYIRQKDLGRPDHTWHAQQPRGEWYYYGPHYSTNIAAAWAVVNKMKDIDPFSGALQLTGALGVDYIEDSDHTWIAHFGHDTSEFYLPGYAAHGKTAPEAICKAALLAVMER